MGASLVGHIRIYVAVADSCSWIYASEIPTARLRALTVALAAATQWLFNFVVARSVPVMLVTVGYVLSSFKIAMLTLLGLMATELI